MLVLPLTNFLLVWPDPQAHSAIISCKSFSDRFQHAHVQEYRPLVELLVHDCDPVKLADTDVQFCFGSEWVFAELDLRADGLRRFQPRRRNRALRTAT